MLGGNPLFASLGRRLSSVPVVSSSTRDLLDDIREDWIYNGEEWTRPGFRALAMYRFGVWRMRVSSGLLRVPLNVVYRFLHRWVRNHYGIELHHTAKIGHRVVLARQGAIVIHELAEIGNECVISHGVTIGAAGKYLDSEAPKLGRGVTLGAGAVLLGNVGESTLISMQFNILLASESDAAADKLGITISQFDTFALLGDIIDDALNNDGLVYGITNIDTPIAPGLPGDPRDVPPAEDPDVALWADDVHPSTVAHEVFANVVFDALITGNPADLDGNGIVGAADLAILLGSWGPCEGCPADLDGDGAVGAADLAILLGS